MPEEGLLTVLGSARSAMLTLHGFSASNYYNVAKLTLLEKNIPFRESLVWPGAGKDYRPDEIPGLSQYLERMDNRPAVKRVREDRDETFPDFIAYIRKRFGG